MKLTASMSRRLLITAMSLSLSGVAGCATPVPGTTALPVETAQATAPTQLTEQPAVPGQAVPAGVAAAQTLALQGVVTFRGEALAGYGVKAYNPLTGAELPLASPIVTDGQGRFQAAVTGLQAGQWVRVVATKGNVALEATTKADAQTPELALTEVATVLSLVADGPLKVAGLLNAEAIGPVADAYMAVLTELRTPVAGALVQTPASANQVIAVPATDKQRSEFEGALETVVSNSGRSQALNDATFALLKAVAAAPHAKQFAAFAVQAADAPKFVRFLGTSFKAGIGGEGNTLQLANVRTGRMVDAAKASTEVFKTLVRKNKKRSSAVTLRFLDRGTAFFSQLFMGEALPGVLMPVERLEADATVDFKLFNPEASEPPALGEDGFSLDSEALAGVEAANYFRLHLDGQGQPAQISLVTPEAFSDFFGESDEFSVQSLAPDMVGPLTLTRTTDSVQAGLIGMLVGTLPAGVTIQSYAFPMPMSDSYQMPWRLLLSLNGAGEVVGFFMLPAFYVTGEIPEELIGGGLDEELDFERFSLYFSMGQRLDIFNQNFAPQEID